MPKDVTKNDKKEVKENKHKFKDFKAELKRVIWPTPKQLVNNTIAVITIVLITAVIVFVLDFAFEGINNYGINKLKTYVDAQNVQENTVNNQTDANNQVEENSEAQANNQVDSNSVEQNVQNNTVANNTAD